MIRPQKVTIDHTSRKVGENIKVFYKGVELKGVVLLMEFFIPVIVP